MSVLKIKDENGKWVGITSLKGEKGEKGEAGSAVVDKATDSTLGVVYADGVSGISVTDEGALYIEAASEKDITEQSNTFKPIVPATLHTAVTSVGDGIYASQTDLERHSHTPNEIGAAPSHEWGYDDIEAGSDSDEPDGTIHLVLESL